MKRILVVNLGSTSFKYRAFDFPDGGEARETARGGFENVCDFGPCIDAMLGELEDGGTPDAVGFKTVLGGELTGCVRADDSVLEALDANADVAPTHNPIYAAGIRAFAERLPDLPRYALFETAFYQWMAPGVRHYAIPRSWRDAGIRRNGFHGASHKFIAERTAELTGRDAVAARARDLYVKGPVPFEGEPLRVVSCHLGGSSSITGIRDGVAAATSFGFSSQSGLPHNNRVGDLDILALPTAMRRLGLGLEEAERQLGETSGLLGLSGVSNDLREIRREAEAGNREARLAIEVLVDSIRHWIGSIAFRLGGLDVLAFTGGIGENDSALRADVCAGLEAYGIRLDPGLNREAVGGSEAFLERSGGGVRCCVIPANEERVIAREVARQLK